MFQVLDTHHLYLESYPVQQLGPQFPFFRIHAPDNYELGWMAYAYPFPFHGVHAHGRRIQECIHYKIIQQVYFIHIQDATVRLGKDAWFIGFETFGNSLFYVQAAHHPVLCGTYRQVDHFHETFFSSDGPFFFTFLAFPAEFILVMGVAAICTSRDHFDLRQDLSQTPDRSGFGSSFLAPYQHSANGRIYCVQDQGTFHLFLAYNGCKGIQYPVGLGLDPGFDYLFGLVHLFDFRDFHDITVNTDLAHYYRLITNI